MVVGVGERRQGEAAALRLLRRRRDRGDRAVLDDEVDRRPGRLAVGRQQRDAGNRRAHVGDRLRTEALQFAKAAPTTTLRVVPLPHSTDVPWGKKGVRARRFPPLRSKSAGEGDHPKGGGGGASGPLT